jgi:hypothetical protein
LHGHQHAFEQSQRFKGMLMRMQNTTQDKTSRMLKTTTRQDKKTRQDKIKCDSFLSCLVVVLSMRVSRPFAEKCSIAA